MWRCIEVTYLRHLMLSLPCQKSWVNSHKACTFTEKHKTSSIWYFYPSPAFFQVQVPVFKWSIEKEAATCYLGKTSSHPLYFTHTSHISSSFWVNICDHSSNLPASTQNLSLCSKLIRCVDTIISKERQALP